MTDPSVQSFSRPIYSEENLDYGDISMHEKYFAFGLYFSVNDGKPITMPENVGRLVSYVRSQGQGGVSDSEARPAVPCSEVFSNIDFSRPNNFTI